MEIAWRYPVARLEAGEMVELAPIVRSCVEQFGHSGYQTIDSEIRRLAKKFTRARDLWLARATGRDNPEYMDMIRDVREVLRLLTRLGVSSRFSMGANC